MCAPTSIWKRGESATLKDKTGLKNRFHLFLLFLLSISIFLTLGSVCSTDATLHTTYYASNYDILNGTYVLGSVPPSITSVDADYLIARSEGTDTFVNMYNPNRYTLLGSTSWVSGSISNLTSNDGVNMIFSSYFSIFEMEDYVDNNTSDVDSTTDRGTHSNFTAQQNGPDLINDTLTEGNINFSYEYLWISGNDDYVRELDKSDPGATEILSWDTGTAFPFGCEFRIEDGNEYIYIVDYGSGVDALIKFHANNGTEITRWDISGYSGDAYGLAWNGSRWFIADTVDDVIYQADPADPTFQERNFTYAGIGFCEGLAWDGSYLWTADSGTDKVYQIDNYGNIQTSWDFTPNDPTGIAYDTNSGHLWITSNIGDLYEYYSNGTEINNWDPPGASPEGVAYATIETDAYQLDLEVQWTSVDFDESNEFLCIYGGLMGAENIRLDAWNGSDWENLFADLNSGWNNVSVSSHLDSSTFTVRFKGDTEIGDTTQDTWSIDAVFLHLWTDQNTVEVEFEGSSDTYNWKQLNWTLDSAWTIESVSVNVQLYNYDLGEYATSGNGFIAYTSNATANTDETKTLTTTVNPQSFRDDAGNWKIKIRGVKNTTTQFDFEADWLRFEPTQWSEYTVSTEFFFSNMTTETPTQLNFTIVSHYDSASVNVTIQVYNYTSASYATSVEACVSYTAHGTNETSLLSVNANPHSYILDGNTKIKVTGSLATPTQFQHEINQVKLLYSYAEPIGAYWVTTLLYVLLPILVILALFLFFFVPKLKRKKKTEPAVDKTSPFSKQFGITHQQMKGKKMLFEIDPTSDYHKDLLSFVSEAKNNEELLFILTNKNSTLHSTFSGDSNVKFLLLTSETSSPQQINERETLLPECDLPVLLSFFDNIQKVHMEKTINVLFDNLSDVILRCGFKKTYKFMRLLLETISSSTVTALFMFNPTAHDKKISSSISRVFHKETA